MQTAIPEKGLYYDKAYQFVTNMGLERVTSSDRMRGIYTCHIINYYILHLLQRQSVGGDLYRTICKETVCLVLV